MIRYQPWTVEDKEPLIVVGSGRRMEAVSNAFALEIAGAHNRMVESMQNELNARIEVESQLRASLSKSNVALAGVRRELHLARGRILRASKGENTSTLREAKKPSDPSREMRIGFVSGGISHELVWRQS